MLTASRLNRSLACIGSTILPRAETASMWADLGHEEHETLSDFESLPPEIAKWIPPGAQSEVKLAFCVATRQGRIVGQESDRSYGEPRPYEIVGSTDVLGVDGDAVVICDFKTGYADVEPARSNAQLWFYALAATRAMNLDRAVLRIIYTKTGRVDEAEVDALELAAFADKLERLHHQVAEAQAAKNRGEVVNTTEGRHCKFCPSTPFCASKVGLLVQLADGELAVIGETAMTPERAAAAYHQFVRVESLVKDAKQRLLRYVDENGPIHIGGGRAFGRYERQGDERLAGDVAVQAIREIVGESADEFEAVAIDRRTTKAALGRAAKAIGERPKLATRVIERIRELGGSTRAAPEMPVGEFSVETETVAEPIDVDAINRLLTESP